MGVIPGKAAIWVGDECRGGRRKGKAVRDTYQGLEVGERMTHLGGIKLGDSAWGMRIERSSRSSRQGTGQQRPL